VSAIVPAGVGTRGLFGVEKRVASAAIASVIGSANSCTSASANAGSCNSISGVSSDAGTPWR
jgi:hypothetical protein